MTDLYISGMINNSNKVKNLIKELKLLKNIEIITLNNDQWNVKDIYTNDYYKSKCSNILHIVTPSTINSYTIADMIDSLNKYKEKTIYCFEISDFDKYGHSISAPVDMSSLKYVSNYIKENGGNLLLSISHISKYISQL